MIYVFNKGKILSYLLASFIVLMLFAFSSRVVPKDDIELLKVSANLTNNSINNNVSK